MQLYLIIYILLFRFWLNRMGSQFVSVHNCPRRTNNNVESFHNKLRLKFCSPHPNLWVFIGKLLA